MNIVTMAEVGVLATELLLSAGVTVPVWLGRDDKMDPRFHAYVEPHENGFAIIVTPELLKLNKRKAKKYLKHEVCHIILDADVIGEKWKELSVAERDSRHRAVERCMASRFEQ